MERPQSGTSCLVGSQTQRDTQSNLGYMKAVLEEEWAETGKERQGKQKASQLLQNKEAIKQNQNK